MKYKRVVYGIIWSIVCFFISLFQNVYSEYIVIVDGKLDISGLIKSKGFWIMLLIWIVGCIIAGKSDNSKEDTVTRLEQINYGNNNIQIGVQNNYGGSESKEYAGDRGSSDCESK